MKAGRPLRLIVDSPYPGESTSSFLSRAAQAYRVNCNALLKQLAPDERKRQSLRDLDRWPSPALRNVLASAVHSWSGEEFLGPFPKRWCVAPTQRTAYCPACFREDLASDRTPYFRSEWMAVLALFCRRHASPLFDWKAVDGHLHRSLPLGWIDRRDGLDETPEFFREHEAMLADVESHPSKEIHPGGPTIATAFSMLRALQDLFEGGGEAPGCSGSAVAPLWVEAAALARIALSLVEEGQPLFRWGLSLAEGAESAWLGPGSLQGRLAKHHKVYVRRRCASVAWRRYYWLFVADRMLPEDSREGSGARFSGVAGEVCGTRAEIDLARFRWLYEAERLGGGLETGSP